MKINMKTKLINIVASVALSAMVIGCSSPEEKAQKYYEKGIELLETNPVKAKLEFQNALQIKRNMVKAVYGLALAAEKQGDWKGAFKLLNKVVADNPNHLEANVKIGQMFLAAGNIEQAEKFLNTSKTIDASNQLVVLLDAALDLKSQRYPQAVSKANDILKSDAANKQALMILATERYQQKDIDKAIVFIDKAIQADDKNLGFKMFKARMLQSKGDFDGVVALYNGLISENPEKTYIRETLAKFYFNNGKLAETEAELKKIIDIAEDKAKAKQNLIKFVASTQGKVAGKNLLEKMVAENPKDYDLGFNLVDLYEQEGDVSASNELLEKIIASAGDEPQGLQAKIRKAYRLSQANKKDEANALIEEVLAKDEGFPKALILKSSLQVEKGKFDDATLTLRRLLRDQPNSVDGLFLMAKVQEMMGSTALADESYVQALSASKDSPRVGLAYAKSLVSRNQNSRAKKVLSDVLKTYPNDAPTNKYLAQLSILDGDMDTVKQLASTLKENDNPALSNLIDGSIKLSEKDTAGAIAAFKNAYNANPNNLQPVLAIVNTYYSQKQHDKAIRFLEQSIKKHSATAYPLKLVLAQLYSRLGKSQSSIQTYESALKLEPKSTQAYQGIISAYMKLGQKDKAKAVLDIGLNKLPNSFDLKMLAAEMYMAEKDYASAEDVYDSLQQAYPQSLVALNNYVSVVADYEEDSAVVKKAYKLAQKLGSSSSPHFLDSLGWISYRDGQHDEAVTHLSAAVKKAPNYAVFQYHLGKSYLAKGNNSKAKEHLEKALELAKKQKFSHTEDIKQILETI